MNYAKLAVALLVSIPALSSASVSYVKDYTPAQLQMFKNISGDYTTSTQTEKMEIVFKAIEEKQGDLFGPLKFEFHGEMYSKVAGDVYFDLEDPAQTTADSINFSLIQDDCDDPGCTTYEAQLTFKKNSSGKFDAIFQGLFITDTEDLAYEANESGLEGAQLEAFLDQKCKDYYNPTARLLDNNGSVFCEYEVSATLQQK